MSVWQLEIEPGWQGATGKKPDTYRIFRNRDDGDGLTIQILLSLPADLFTSLEAAAILVALNKIQMEDR